VYVDGTFGRGGYSRALLAEADCHVVGIDRDPQAVAHGRALEQDINFGGRLRVLDGCFGDMVALLADVGVERVDGVTLDLGVSSPQLDEAERGFSFLRDGPLDMRMSLHGASAADLVNTLDEGDLADVIYRYGEERRSRHIARAIVAARPIHTTLQLASVVHSVMRRSPDGIDTATRTFQALRIAVNDELGELERGLAAAEALLAPGGRLAVVSFHSLEDRIVKHFLRVRSGGEAGGSRHRPDSAPGRAPTFTLISKKPIMADADEAAGNPRARSAKLRAAVRTEAPAWPGPVSTGREAA
jgi:16S rRNA (cytosine1402-N4)-methyltransferase